MLKANNKISYKSAPYNLPTSDLTITNPAKLALKPSKYGPSSYVCAAFSKTKPFPEPPLKIAA
jgi:hypothetical protein